MGDLHASSPASAGVGVGEDAASGGLDYRARDEGEDAAGGQGRSSRRARPVLTRAPSARLPNDPGSAAGVLLAEVAHEVRLAAGGGRCGGGAGGTGRAGGTR